jgi:hypothetical protein
MEQKTHKYLIITKKWAFPGLAPFGRRKNLTNDKNVLYDEL